MATVGIWAIKSNLKQVINYTTDTSKTDESIYEEIHKAIDYIENDSKTENKLYVDVINIDVKENALQEMIDVKKRFHKENGILGFHSFHSYKKGEVTPELAHEVGMQIAKEMWGDRFQVIVSTHLNTDHIHNHFVINSVSFLDGKRYYDNRTSYAELRRISNEICKENGLSYLEEKKTKKGIDYSNYQKKNITYSNYYKTAKNDLDIAISQAKSFNEFITILENMNYTIINRSGKISIRNNEYKRNIRIERYFGEDYSIENIEKQIKGLYISRGNTFYRTNKIDNNLFKSIFKTNHKGLYAMYIHYLNLLKAYPTYVKYNKYPKYLKNDLNKMEELSHQARILGENKIITNDDFELYLNSKNKELSELKINESNIEKIRILQKEIKDLEKIKKRNEIISKNIELFEQEKEVRIR